MSLTMVSAAGVPLLDLGVPGGNSGESVLPLVFVAFLVVVAIAMIATLVRLKIKAARLPEPRAGPAPLQTLVMLRYDEARQKARWNRAVHLTSYSVAALFAVSHTVIAMFAESAYAHEHFQTERSLMALLPVIALPVYIFLGKIASRAQARATTLIGAVRKVEELLADAEGSTDVQAGQRKAARLLGHALATAAGSDASLLSHG
ncbi:MAG TPA: hypothetical protein VEU30_11025 [Thermoanaerobaculia bacterium]|nr:hypothetical protein [Thermoanaerobaculia bacterium]